MSGKSSTEGCQMPTRVRTVTEKDAWRARQELASKSRSSSSSSLARGGAPQGVPNTTANAPYHQRCRPSAGGAGGGSSSSSGAANGAGSVEAPVLPEAKQQQQDPSLEVKPPAASDGSYKKADGDSDNDNNDHDAADDGIFHSSSSSVTPSRAGGGGGGGGKGLPNSRAVLLPPAELTTSPFDAAPAAIGFPPNSVEGSEARRGRGGGGAGHAEVPAPEWRSGVAVMGESDDEVEVEEGAGGEGGVGGLRGDLEAFTAALRRDFELKVLVTATEGVKAASDRAARAGELRLLAYRDESEREVRRLGEEGRRLRERVAGLERANACLTDKVEVLGERLSALHARTSSGSAVARCLCTWRTNATRARSERSKNAAAARHARRTLVSKTLNVWREETRLRVNNRGRKAADLKLRAISKEIIGRYEAELSSTRAALDDANSQIAVEKARQREMETGMRRTLLRGMSAMNMEAMHLLAEAREAGEDTFGVASGASVGTRYSTMSRTAPSAASSRPSKAAHQRLSDECPRPLAPPKPTAAPASR